MSYTKPDPITEDDFPLVSLSQSGLHIESYKVAKKLAKVSLSPSTIASLEQCPAKWAFEKYAKPEILPEDKDTPGRRGSVFHDIMEEFFRIEPPQDRTTSELTRITKEVISEKYPDFKDNPEVIQWVKEAIQGYYKMGGKPQSVIVADTPKNKRNPNDPDETQKGLEIFVKGKLGDSVRSTLGFIDQVLEDPHEDGAVIISDWKGLALDTPIPTYSGWTTMGEVAVGDRIIGTDGSEISVTRKSSVHNRDCYKITFFDGSSVISDNVHLWKIRFGERKDKAAYTETVSTDELYERSKTLGKKSLQIENPKAIQFEHKSNLTIDPYVLGVWLGDGANRSGVIHSGLKDHEDMAKLLRSTWGGEVSCREEKSSMVISLRKPYAKRCYMGHECERTKGKNGVPRCIECIRHRNYSQKSEAQKLSFETDGTNVGLTALLRRNNLLHNKHIPSAYLRGSIEQRLELIRGLMDSDGYWNPARNRALFYTTTKALADGISEIIFSLGITPTINRGENDHKGYYEIGFVPTEHNPFKLPRKAGLAQQYLESHKGSKHKARHRYIKDIEKIDSVPTQCIQVDADDSMFLCGESMVPTHNSGAKFKEFKKTTKSNDGFNEVRQQIIYSMLMEQSSVNVSSARLIYPVARKVINVDIHDQEIRLRIIKTIEEADQLLEESIENNTFEYGPSVLCSWCPLALSCPAAMLLQFPKARDAQAQQPDPEDLKPGVAFK